jgi:Fur family zinc uptake transcriptional regulator
MSAIGFENHDHATCIASTLKQAEDDCVMLGLKFTPVRRRSLEILLREHRAMGAYDLLAVLANDGHSAQPPVAYRALDFLVSAGFAHKIERLNAYIACSHLGADHTPAFLICRNCRAVGEADASQVENKLDVAAQAVGFHIERTVVEAEGLCPSCQDGA